jgi:alkanesulfonate monooxygenase SsuD/methylene tetrahydromethanopterin reductase-like flavin-dependent oxidoreductase (luciferase family)
MERWDEQVSHRELFENLTELTLLAEEGGFSTVWIGEHHSMEYTISPNPMPQLAYLAARTSTIRLGAGTIIAPFWNPIRVAGECAMLDVISNGRAEIGLARGAYQFEFDRMAGGIPASSGGTHLRELVPAVRKLWEGDYAHDGEIWQFPTSTSVPKPLQQPNPPIWIAARDPNSHDFAVSNGCNVQVTPLALGDEEVDSLMQRFNDACASHSDIPRPKIMVLRHTYVGSDESDVDQAAREISVYYNYFGAWFKNEKPVTQGLIERLTDDELAANPAYSPEVIRANAVVGTADEVIARLKHCADLGYDEYSLWIDTGMSFERKRQSLQRFIDDVMPAFVVSGK